MYIILLLVAIIAGLIQGITGFGAGIMMMVVLPMFYQVIQSAGISGCICVFLSGYMVYLYYRDVNIKKVIKPAILYLLICSIAINYSFLIDQAVMKKIFGLFLIILSIYYLFINKKSESKELGLLKSIGCISISALCDGLFGIGGPLMVIYFMANTKSTREYLGSIQCFFLVNGIYNTSLRIYRGIITPEHSITIICGVIGIIIGVFIAGKVVNSMDDKLIKKMTYIVIGLSGVINIL